MTHLTTSFASLLQDRYGREPDAAVAGVDHPVLAQMLAHRTHRAYLPDPVGQDALNAAIIAAQSAPSSSNLQNWSVIAVTDPARKARLSALCGNQSQIDQAPLMLIWIADLARNKAISDALGGAGAVFDYTEALMMGVIDSSLAAQNAALAFEALGYGCCYIGGARNQMAAMAQELGLPPLTMAVFGLTVGRPKPEVTTDIKPRLPLSAVLMAEGYQPPAAEDLAAYDDAMIAFQNKQAMKPIGWTKTVSRRFDGLSALTGREQTRDYLAAADFKLK